ncbi:MAG: DUF2490 domain-containing protein [Pedobacter sp.]|nr:MAG: DUF2490 domain-containing protein [Pedobacter sp.]
MAASTLFVRACALVLIILVTGPLVLVSQQDYRAGTLTQINVNTKLPNNYKLNTKLEARQIFSEKERSGNKSSRLRYERTDLHFVLTKKISADNSLGGGYLVRLEDGDLTHRFIQQFNNVHTLDVLNVAHRIVLDETITKSEPLQVRLRYRLGLERALNGQSVDPREFYLKINNEYLGIWTRENTDLEIRAAAMIGYNATDNNKIELGPEYRINEFYTGTKSQQFWLSIGWYVSF